MQSGNPAPGRKVPRYMVSLVIVVVTIVVVVASYAVVSASISKYRLLESSGSLAFEIDDLPHGFYQMWDNASVSIFSGESMTVDQIVTYPIHVSWNLNSSRLTDVGGAEADFGAVDVGGSWFNLSVEDDDGDGFVGNGDWLKVYSLNGSFSDDTVYFLRFNVCQFEVVAPYYMVFGFEFSGDDFDSWVETEPNEFAL